MAIKTSGTGGAEADLTAAQIAALRAQTGLSQAQINQMAAENALKGQELQQRGQIATEGFKVDREKIGLGQQEMTSKDKQAKLGAALELLGQGSKEKIAGQSEKAGLQADLSRRTDIPQDVLARTLAAGGNPELFNALAQAKLDKQNTAIRSFIQPLQSAKSDADREKKLKPALESIRPGAYQEALALAYPKAGQAAPTATPEPAPTPTTPAASGGETTNPLAAVLLAAAGFGDGNNGAGGGNGAMGKVAPRVANVDPNYPVLPNTPEVAYTGRGHGSLEGSIPVAGGIQTPSGGFIGLRNGISRNLAELIAPRGTDPSSLVGPTVATPTIPYNDSGETPQVMANGGLSVPIPVGDEVTGGQEVPKPNIPLVSPAPFDFGKLLSANPNPTPVPVAPTVTPAPNISAEQAAQLAEAERQRQLRAALAAQQNQQ
jgi:hypothetical protein